jgi:hypothetical protein
MREKLLTTLRRTIGLLLALAIGLALLPQASFAATKQYDMSGLRMQTNKFKDNTATYSGTVKVNFPVVGFVDANIKITMIKSDPYTSIFGDTTQCVTFRVTYKLSNSAQKKLKKNSEKIVKQLKSEYAMYPYHIFLLDSKTGKVAASTASYGGISFRTGVGLPTKKNLGKLSIITACEYEYKTKDFHVNEDTSFIFGIASPNSAVYGKYDLSSGSSAIKNAKKFYNGKVALKKSIYFKKGQKNRSLWVKFEHKAK